MKILSVHNFYQKPGGEDVVFHSEAGLLEAHGHEVVRHTVSSHEIAQYGLATLAAKTLWNSTSRHELQGVIERTHPDLMHVHNTFPLLSPSIYSAAHAAGIPVVQTLHNFRLLCPRATLRRDGHLCEDCIGTRTYWPSVAHACYRDSRAATAATAAMLTTHRMLGTWQRIERFIAISEFSKSKFVEAGWAADRIAVKPNFLDSDPGVSEARGDYALFVGRLSEEKGLTTLLSAVTRMARPPLLKIAGQGPMMPADTGGDPRVEWLGHQTRAQVLDLMKGAAVLIVPSEWYETGVLTIIEAFACGLPVIASRLGTMAEMVTEGVTGRLFAPRDPDELAATLAWALEHRAETRVMAQRARLRYEQRYAPEPNYRMLMRIYTDAIGSTQRPVETAAAV